MSKRSPKKDPFQQREAEKYQNPIPSREFIMELLENEGRPLNRDQITALLKLEDEESLEALRRRLRAMERDGQLIYNRRGEYGLVRKMDLLRGRVIGHPEGFGFMVPDEGGGDLFLSAREMRGAMHGDRVVARVSGLDRRGRREGSVVEILERANKRIVGRYTEESGVGFVSPDNKRLTQEILITSGQNYGARNGQFVVAEILEYPTPVRQGLGRVIEILGDHMAPGMEIDIAIRAYQLPQEWSPLVEAETAELPMQVPEADKRGREDLRAMPLVTIDGDDSMDFDDAVYCEPSGDGWRLVVAIADVSHYVRTGTALDAEARQRGNSVYFPGRVIPMLPEGLSNILCSLNPDVDRLCMVSDMQVSAKGELKEYRFYPAVMRSHARMTYTKVAAIVVDHDPLLREAYRPLLPHFDNLYKLYKVLHGRREKRGAIDFDTTETRVVFGEGKKIERIVPVVRNDAHRLIEECMLLANVATADFLAKGKIPSLYRVHEPPSQEKLTNLREFLSELGLSLRGGEKPEAKHYGELLESVRERPDAHLIQTVMLRSLSQAVYSPENKGHFGLAYEAYAHFTSPIRRYPDLLVHRAIRHLLTKKKVESFHYGVEDMLVLGEHCSMTERRADEATRDALDWLKCEFMLDRVGEEFNGIISSVTSFGIFVELQDIYVEGLVHITALNSDYYHFDPAKHRLVGERTRRIYRLADKVRVKVLRVDLDERKLDFELADGGDQPAEGRAGKGKRTPGKPGQGKSAAGKSAKGKSVAQKPAAEQSAGEQTEGSGAGKKRRRRRRR